MPNRLHLWHSTDGLPSVADLPFEDVAVLSDGATAVADSWPQGPTERFEAASEAAGELDWFVFGDGITAATVSVIASDLSTGGDERPVVFYPSAATREEVSLYENVPGWISVPLCRPTDRGVVALRGDLVRSACGEVSRSHADFLWSMALAATGRADFRDQLAEEPLRLGPALDVTRPRPAGLPPLGQGRLSAPAGIELRLEPIGAADLVFAALNIVHGDLDRGHHLAQLHEGNVTADYLHAIVHRREGDYGNAAYWFRRAQRHPVLARLARDGVATGEPFAFLDICRRHVGDDSPQERLAREAQWVEMLALLTHTAGETV